MNTTTASVQAEMQGVAAALGCVLPWLIVRPRMASRSKRRSTSSTSAPTTSISSTASAAPSGQFCA